MAHELMTQNGEAAMMYVGDKPWHVAWERNWKNAISRGMGVSPITHGQDARATMSLQESSKPRGKP